MNKKLNLIFDITVLIKWGESGVYNCALNILKEFSKNDNINITLYFSYEQTNKLKDFLNKEKWLKKYPILYNKIILSLFNIYLYLTKKKQEANTEKRNGQKRFLNLILKIIRPLHKVSVYLINYNKYNAFFSPLAQIPKHIACIKHIKNMFCFMTSFQFYIPIIMVTIQ